MKAQTKQRMIGGVVLLALLAIFLPMFFSSPHPSAQMSLTKHIPKEPQKPQITLTLPTQAKAMPANPNVAVQAQAPVQMPSTQTASKADVKVAVKIKPAPAKKPVVAVKPEITPIHRKTWVLQVASYRNVANAKRMIKQLTIAGFKAYSIKSNQGMITQVVIGPASSREDAAALQAKLKKTTQMTGLIRRQRS